MQSVTTNGVLSGAKLVALAITDPINAKPGPSESEKTRDFEQVIVTDLNESVRRNPGMKTETGRAPNQAMSTHACFEEQLLDVFACGRSHALAARFRM